MEYPVTMGLSDIPAEVRERFCQEEREYLIAAGTGNVLTGCVLGAQGGFVLYAGERLFSAHLECLGFADPASGQQYAMPCRLCWFLTQHTADQRAENGRIGRAAVYRVRGCLSLSLRRQTESGTADGYAEFWVKEILADNVPDSFLQALIDAQYPMKEGIAEIDPAIQEIYGADLHEYLIAAGGEKRISGRVWPKLKCDPSIQANTVSIIGYTDLTTGEKSDSGTGLTWYLTEEENRRSNFMAHLESDVIYRIKGYPPLRPASETVEFMDGIFVREILERGVQDAYLQSVIDAFHHPAALHSDVLGELECNKFSAWITAKTVWAGKEVLCFIDGTAHDTASQIRIAEALVSESAAWEQTFRRGMAEHLLDTANKMLREHLEDEEETVFSMTAEDFLNQISIEDITVERGGRFHVMYFTDEEMLGETVPILLYGTLEKGVTEYEMEYQD